MIRSSVISLSNLGSMPTEDAAIADAGADFERIINQFQTLIEAVPKPISDEEAEILIDCFNKSDDCFGVGWSLIHLIETAPGWPMKELLEEREGYCIDLMRQRCVNSGYKL